MSSFPASIITLTILSLSLFSTPTFSFSFQFPNHKSKHLLLGNAHFINNNNNNNTVQLNQPTPSSYGVILPTTPFNFTSSTSLSTHFTFQLGYNVALVIIPYKFVQNMSFEVFNANRLLGIEFYVNVCNVSFSRASDVSNVGYVLRTSNVLNEGVMLSAWIDYYAVLKRLDVRVSKLGDPKPVEPLVSYGSDLWEVLGGEEVLLGLGCVNEKRERVTFVYSWSLEVKDVPKWVHSIPVNPDEFSSVESVSDRKEGGFVSGFVFAIGCGALAALVMFFVWAYVVGRENVEGEDSARVGDFKYEKIDVVEGKNAEGGMK